MKKLRGTHRMLVVAAAAATALGLVAAVQASIPDGSGVIHGCYKDSGDLRVIDTASAKKDKNSCKKDETPLDWNADGPIGPEGPPGPQGPPGPKGDQGPTYNAGTGLNLSGGNTFSIQGSYRLPQGCGLNQAPYQTAVPNAWGCFTAANAGENCSSGKFQNGVDANGDITCASPPTPVASPGPDGWVTRHPENQDTPENTDVTVATLSLPTGTFSVAAHGVADNDGGNAGDTIILSCWFGPGGFSLSNPFTSTHGDGGFIPFSLADFVTLATPGDVTLVCSDGEPHTHVQDIQMTAVKLGTATTQ